MDRKKHRRPRGITWMRTIRSRQGIKLIATGAKQEIPPPSLEDQRGSSQPQNNQMEDTVKQLRDHGYKVTEEYSNSGQLVTTQVPGSHAIGKGEPLKTAAMAASMERPCLRMVER